MAGSQIITDNISVCLCVFVYICICICAYICISQDVDRQTGRQLPVGGCVVHCTHHVGSDHTAHSDVKKCGALQLGGVLCYLLCYSVI